MYSVYDTRCRVGCPIRIPTDQRLLAAPRGFSQRATSFIASWCQGIHRMPFLYSIFATWLRRAASTMHRNHPQTQLSGFSRQLPEVTATDQTTFEDKPENIYSAHNRIFSNRSFAGRLRDHREPFDKIVHNASEHSPPTVGALSSQTAIPGQTIQPDDAPVLRGQLSGIRTGSTGQSHAPTPADDAP